MLTNMDTFTTDRISDLSSLAGLDINATNEIVKLGEEISKDDELSHIFCEIYNRLYFNDNYSLEEDKDFFIVQKKLGDNIYKYNLFLAISGISNTLEIHKARNIPENVTRETVRDISLRTEFIKKHKQIIGLETQILQWCKSYLTGNLFQLGRLQFRHFHFHGIIYAFRHRKTGRVIAFPKEGTVFNSSGLRDGVNGIFDKNAWAATFEMTDKYVKGFPIAPNGYASKKVRSLSLNDWENVISPGDPMLDIHIPAGGSMSHEACASSIETANCFFTKYFPEKPFQGFACRSWFLDPQLRNILKSESNIIKFQKSCYLFPTIGDDNSAIERIFGEEFIGIAKNKLPCDNSLRRAVIDFMESGRRLRMGACFFLKADLPWRLNVYQEDTEENSQD